MYNHLAMAIASLFGIGYIPFCPGTFGTFAAIFLYAVIARFSLYSQVGAIFVIFFIGVWAAQKAEKILNKKDPTVVVIDEAAGYLLTMCFLPFSITVSLIGFFLFRIFDILKPFPIKRLEKISGGWGIMMDDILAGIYSSVVLRVILYFIGLKRGNI
ncbi:phosphatidylglycerophosphatase A [bacterium]|nr:phosphatidylglycerophosphatase A [bacterium]